MEKVDDLIASIDALTSELSARFPSQHERRQHLRAQMAATILCGYVTTTDDQDDVLIGAAESAADALLRDLGL